MELFPVFSAMLAVAALFAWLNVRLFRLPTTVGVMLIALAVSVLVFLLQALGLDLRTPAAALLLRVDLPAALLDVMLAFLLFAGALHVKLEDLLAQKRVVGILATAGVAASTLVVGILTRLLLGALGMDPGFLSCLLFGALISPTDPIAVLGIMKNVGAPKSLETKIAGESLFNDGIGVVVFSMVLAMAAAAGGGEVHGPTGPGAVFLFLLQEVGGALFLGLAGGWLAYLLLLAVDDPKVEVLVTLASAMGLYSLASGLHSSGPLAVVVAGLFIGNHGRRRAMSRPVEEHLDVFWELVDEFLNVLLFVLLGLEVLVLDLHALEVLAGLLVVPIVLLARFGAVAATVGLLRRRRPFTPGAVRILTWAGLRGGISVALALSIGPEVPGRDLLVAMTWVVVVFSILVQGLTVGPLVRRLVPRPA